jgi:hypothetical protein
VEATEETDLKNGVTEKTAVSEKKIQFFSVLFVGSVAPFLRSATSVARESHALLTDLTRFGLWSCGLQADPASTDN